MKKIVTATLCGLLFMSLPALADTKQPNQRSEKPVPSVQAPFSPLEISNDLKSQQQKLEFFKDRLDWQDKRIGDIGLYLAVFGALMTIMVVFFSLRSNRDAVQAAKDEARKEIEKQAKEAIESWLNKDGQQLLTEKVEATLGPEIDKALSEIRNVTGGVLEGLEEEHRKAHDQNVKQEQLINDAKAIHEQLSNGLAKNKPLSADQIEAVDKATQELGFKAPNDYRSEDWYMLGMQAYKSAKYEVAKEYFAKAIEIASLPLSKAKALLYMGITLGELKQSEEEIARYDDVVRHFGEATEPELSKQVAKALMNKALTLAELKRREEEVAVYDDMVQRFSDSKVPALREQVAKALGNKALTLGELNRVEEEIAVYDDLVRRFGDSKELALRVNVAKALANKGIALAQLERRIEGIVVYDEVVQRFGTAAELELREQVARALTSKGVSLDRLKRSDDEIAVYDEVIKRFGDSTESALREQVATALVYKGITLGQLQRSKEGIAVYDEVVQRFGESPELAVRELVAKSLLNKGIALGRLNHREEEIAVYDEVVRLYGDATEPALQEKVRRALVLKGGAMKKSPDK